MRWLPCLLFPLFLYGADTEGAVGWIVKCRGDWREDAKAKIPCQTPEPKLWYPVTLNSKLVRETKQAGDLVVFKAASNGQRKVFDCDKPANCEPNPPISLYVPKPPKSNLLAFLGGVEKPYMQIRLTQSRSSDARSRDSAIADYAVAESGSIPIAKLFRDRVPAGDYLVELCPFNAEKGCPERQAFRKIHLQRPQPDAFWPEPCSPGLYEIVLIDETGGVAIRTKDRALLLVTPKSPDGKSFQELQANVDSAAATFLNDWTDRSEGRQMFSAFLLYLSEQFPK